ncbi:hypothetical protein EB796_020571 [Bugula neritina]|uniref:Uncharacterized protein n=1 Tax=Bugula neritina TaxID=10212 RepID=A0A7J7J6R6_BUGNE|nr:hypothetical protein EB796_020571 [Bugula neritina]
MSLFPRILLLVIFITVLVECKQLFKQGRFDSGFIPPPKYKHDSSLPPDLWFDQVLDHFNPQDLRSWKQRYFINDTFYKPGGPVFLQIGGEGTADPIWMVTGACVDYAEQYSALIFQVEHRYYGKSHPVTDLSTPNLKYLSSEQALEDLAYFITSMNSRMDLNSAKWIAFGGSYPGSLATWLRMKYPHLVYAAIASSAPLVATADFSDYLRVVRDSLDTTGPTCVENIAKATDTLTNLVQDQDGLCDDIDFSNKNDVANLFSSLAGNFEGVVQYNKDNRAFEGGVGYNITIDMLCDIMNQDNQPINNYAQVNSLILKTYSQKCLDFKYTNMIKELQDTTWAGSAAVGGRQWTYQTCTEFGYYQTSSYASQPFGDGFPLDFWTQQCSDIFGASINETVLNNAIKFTNANYGGLGVKVSRIIFPNGSIDPWHALSVTKDLSPEAIALFINGLYIIYRTAHCANMYPPSPDDLPALTAARVVINKSIGAWLNE